MEDTETVKDTNVHKTRSTCLFVHPMFYFLLNSFPSTASTLSSDFILCPAMITRLQTHTCSVTGAWHHPSRGGAETGSVGLAWHSHTDTVGEYDSHPSVSSLSDGSARHHSPPDKMKRALARDPVLTETKSLRTSIVVYSLRGLACPGPSPSPSSSPAYCGWKYTWKGWKGKTLPDPKSRPLLRLSAEVSS